MVGTSYRSLSFLSSTCFSGINWRRLIVRDAGKGLLMMGRLFGVYD